MTPPRALSAAATALALAGGCGGSSHEQLTVLAAASLTEVFPRIDGGARYSFAGTDELATQIREGARADVFAAASPRYARELFDEELVEEPHVFALNRLVAIVPRASEAGVGSVADLARPGVKLVIGAEGVPLGDYTRRALERLGASEVLRNVVSEEEDAKGVLGKVALGEADAGIVYATDAGAAEGDVRAIELPPAARVEIEYSIAVVRTTGNRGGARAFVERVLGEQGRRELAAAGFGVP